MQKMVICGLFLAGLVSGCASGPTSTARNVETGAFINSVAGTPGAGVVGLAAMAVDIVSRTGKPEVGSSSPELKRHLFSSPRYIAKDGKEEWAPRKGQGGVIHTVDNTPQESRDYAALYTHATSMFKNGEFGDTETERHKNLLAWENRQTVVAEYTGRGNAKIVIISEARKPGEAMTGDEWAARLQAGMKK